MKCTDYSTIKRAIIVNSKRELERALKPYGGEFTFDNEPMVTGDCKGTTQNVIVYKVSYDEDNDKLSIYCKGYEDGEDYTLRAEEVEAGDLEYIINEIPPKDGVEDVTSPFSL